MDKTKNDVTNDEFVNGVINALKCVSNDCDIRCEKCAYQKYGWKKCIRTAAENAVDIIEKLRLVRLENNALYEILKKSDDEISELRAELIKRQGLEESYSETVKKIEKQAKKTIDFERDKAIKEFAEEVKESHEKLFNNIYTNRGFAEVIDDLVKEMTDKKERMKWGSL